MALSFFQKSQSLAVHKEPSELNQIPIASPKVIKMKDKLSDIELMAVLYPTCLIIHNLSKESVDFINTIGMKLANNSEILKANLHKLLFLIDFSLSNFTKAFKHLVVAERIFGKIESTLGIA
jgi:hypothetical protein